METNKILTSRVLALTILMLLAGLTTISFASGETAETTTLDEKVIVQFKDSGKSGSGFTPPPINVSRAPQLTTINVIYNSSICSNQDQLSDWPENAKTAFTYALNIWGSIIVSDVPIEVHACWEDFNRAGSLGYAGAWGNHRNFSGAPISDTWYPSALANALAGSDIDPSKPEIRAAFNSDDVNWYFGTDGQPAFNQHDFVTVVLHEVGHGIGFAGSAEVGLLDGQTVGRWGLGSGFPFIFDRYVVDGVGQNVINTSVYPNTSPQLASLFQSNNIFFAGSNVQAANGDSSAKLYAPASWQQGSSYSHFDLATFSGTPNSLMMPSLSSGVANHSPGPVGAALLQDLGWDLAGDDPVTETPTAVPTETATETATVAPTETATETATNTPTATATSTETLVPTGTQTATAEPTSETTPDATGTLTSTPEATPVSTETATMVPTETTTPQSTSTGTPVPTGTQTATAEPTNETTPDATGTITSTPEATPVSTETATAVPTETTTAQPVGTGTPAPTGTPILTATPNVPTSLDLFIFLPNIIR